MDSLFTTDFNRLRSDSNSLALRQVESLNAIYGQTAGFQKMCLEVI